MWQRPISYPDLSSAKMISLDVETLDPNLKEKGPGNIRKDGYIVGVSLSTEDGFSQYYPLRHECGGNVPLEPTCRWLNDQLSTNIPKLGAKIFYDISWLRTDNIHVGGIKYDIQIAEALLNENRFRYGLEYLAKDYLNKHKDEAVLKEAAIRAGVRSGDAKKCMHKLAPELVGQYAQTDTDLPLEIFAKQKPLLDQEDLFSVFTLESELIDMLVDMRERGVPVDLAGAERAKTDLEKHEVALQAKLKRTVGFEVNVWAADSVGKAFDKLGIPYNRTPKTKAPSFPQEWLDRHPSELAQLIVEVRRVSKMNSTFITNMILGSAINGRIHPMFNQTRDDESGTVSGRFSSSNPNLQQVPSRHPVYGPLIRGLFIPEPGTFWRKCDYSQQEPRVTVHYAYLRGFRGAQEARDRYHKDPNTDYHTYVSELCTCQRRLAKDINLGLAYGMGIPKMAEKLGLSKEATKKLFDTYHANVGYMRPLAQECMNFASTRGWIKTILGRRRHFDSWVPPGFDKENPKTPLPYEQAVAEYGLPLKRAFTHKALNSLIQGSSADMIKKGMLDCYHAGILPYLTVHDELDDAVESPEDDTMKQIMLDAVKLEVPLKVDMFIEKNWGACK